MVTKGLNLFKLVVNSFINLLKTHWCHHKTSKYYVYVVHFKEVAFDKYEEHSENGL